MAFSCTITVNAGKMPNAQSNFVWLAVAANFPLAAKDGGASSILNGGGNLRCYTDSTKATRLPLDVVSFVTGASPVIQVWGLSPTLNVASTVYIEADEVETTQPAFSAAFGRNAVRSEVAQAVTYNSLDDRTGNGNNLTYSAGAAKTANGFTGDGGDFITPPSSAGVRSSGVSMSSSSISKVSTWIYRREDRSALSFDENFFGLYTPGSVADGLVCGLFQNKVVIYSVGGNTVSRSGAQSISLNTWYKVDIVYDQVSNTVAHYINGALDGSVVNGYTDDSDVINGDLYWGDTNNLGDIGINGILDNSSFSISNSGSDHYNADYITSEYNNQSDPASFWSTSAWEDSGGGGLTPVTKSFSAQFDINQRLSKSFTGSVALLAQVNKNYQAVIDFLSSNQVSKAFSFNLDLLQKKQQQVQLVTDLLARDTSAFSGQLDLLARLTKNHTSTFDALARKTLTHSGVVNFLGHKSVDFSAVIDLLNRQSKSFTGAIDFYQKVNKSFTYQFDMLATGRASKAFSFQVDLLGHLKKQYTSEINLLQRQGLSHQLTVDLLERVIKDFSAQLDLLNTQSKSFTVTLDCIGRVGKTFDVVFNLQSDDTPKTPAHYVISMEHIIEFIDKPVQTLIV